MFSKVSLPKLEIAEKMIKFIQFIDESYDMNE